MAADNFDASMKVIEAAFFVEADELLTDMESNLLEVESLSEPMESIHAIFRAAHTIKGSAGLFGHDMIVSFTHVMESVLDEVREGAIPMSSGLVAALLPCCDHIQQLLSAVKGGALPISDDLVKQGKYLHERLEAFMPMSHLVAEVAAEKNNQQVVVKENLTKLWHLSLGFSESCFCDGMDPLSFIRYLETLGTVETFDVTLSDGMPVGSALNPELCYLKFEVNFRTQADYTTIDAVFDFVRQGSRIEITSDVPVIMEAAPILVSAQSSSKELVQQNKDATAVSSGSSDKSRMAAKEVKSGESSSIRVDAERLDRLIDLVGELVIAGAGVNLRAIKSGDSALLESASAVMRLVEEVRDSALQLRMVQIGTTFNRFQRLVRDVSTDLGKDICLITSGGETEVDKSVVEKIGDPLTHLVRNAMDHGIEPVAVRLAAGKPAQGTVGLHARHEAGSIIIEVQDDGGGLDRDRIVAKAVEKGLIPAGQELSDKEAFDLVFEAGFSTAAQITNLSGRGVGMDVVRRNIADLRGTVEIESEKGVGTCMRIRLPLTLAIIDGFLVGVGKASFVVPLDRVVECLELRTQTVQQECMSLRGEVLPFIRLNDLFGIKDRGSTGRENIVVVEYGGSKAGLVVDALIGEFQTVIKPLGKLFGHVRGISGSTILGSGEVALILDVPNLVQGHVAAERLRA